MSDSSATADPMEAEIRLAVKHSIKQSLGLPLASWSEAYLVEAVLVDVTAAGNPASPEDAISRYSELIQDTYQHEPEDMQDFATALVNQLQAIHEKQLEDRYDSEAEGGCAMCERHMPLTKHHLIPRDVHKERKKRGCSAEQLNTGIMVCRPCHSAIHRTFSNKQLAAEYNSLDKLMGAEALQRFVGWARKQRLVSSSDVLHNRHFRYQR